MKKIIKTAARFLRSLITRKTASEVRRGPRPLELRLTQEPYLTSEYRYVWYEAHAVDYEGREYKVIWEVVEDWREHQDASDHCDWDDYMVYSLDRGECLRPWEVVTIVHP